MSGRDDPDPDRPDDPTPSRARVREATPGDELAVRRTLDAALLDVPDDLSDRVAAGEVLVSTSTSTNASGDGDESGTVTGALVLDGGLIAAVAVRRRRRGRGVGSALVAAAADRADGPLTAEFRPAVRPFYESLGFDIEEDADGRLRGRLG